jgi:hypothetical protein
VILCEAGQGWHIGRMERMAWIVWEEWIALADGAMRDMQRVW